VGLDPKQIIEIRNLIRTLGKDHTVILSTHILQEVQAVCDRIVIINKGKVVADELTENINRVADGDRRYRVKICGPQREVLNMLNDRPDLTFVEALPERDGEAYTYMVESAPNVDMRKSLFYTLAQKGWPLVGMEALGMSLEDVFISIVDKTDGNDNLPKKGGKNARRGRTATDAEQDLAQAILDATAEQQKNIAPYVEGDD
jgi:ABC-2 type transport system ATP-binding protein